MMKVLQVQFMNLLKIIIINKKKTICLDKHYLIDHNKLKIKVLNLINNLEFW